MTPLAAAHHTRPSGPLLVIVIIFAVLYFAWRTGRLRGLRGHAGLARMRSELRGLRVGPLTFLPLALLLIVVGLLLLAH